MTANNTLCYIHQSTDSIAMASQPVRSIYIVSRYCISVLYHMSNTYSIWRNKSTKSTYLKTLTSRCLLRSMGTYDITQIMFSLPQMDQKERSDGPLVQFQISHDLVGFVSFLGRCPSAVYPRYDRRREEQLNSSGSKD